MLVTQAARLELTYTLSSMTLALADTYQPKKLYAGLDDNQGSPNLQNLYGKYIE